MLAETPPMQHRRLGKTDIDIPVIGFGCGRQAQLMIGDDEELRLETVRLALAGGLNYFECSVPAGDTLLNEGLASTTIAAADHFDELAIEGEPLQADVRAVGD